MIHLDVHWAHPEHGDESIAWPKGAPLPSTGDLLCFTSKVDDEDFYEVECIHWEYRIQPAGPASAFTGSAEPITTVIATIMLKDAIPHVD